MLGRTTENRKRIFPQEFRAGSGSTPDRINGDSQRFGGIEINTMNLQVGAWTQKNCLHTNSNTHDPNLVGAMNGESYCKFPRVSVQGGSTLLLKTTHWSSSEIKDLQSIERERETSKHPKHEVRYKRREHTQPMKTEYSNQGPRITHNS